MRQWQSVQVIAVVALRKESVDRNKAVILTARLRGVALRKESVDRNQKKRASVSQRKKSLSARRAWIEIHCQIPQESA